MVAALQPLETKLGDLYKGVPNMPENGRKWLVDAAPWLALIFGVLALFLAWGVWTAATLVSSVVSYTNALSSYVGSSATVAASGWTLWLWVALALTLAEAVLYLLAFPALRAHRKMGWDLLFYGIVINLVYAIITLFAFPSSAVSSLLGALIGSAIGFYILYQIRSAYTAKA